MIVYNNFYDSFYDKDENGNISKVLRCFHGHDKDNFYVTFPRFPFADNGEFIELTNEEINLKINNQVIELGLTPIECEYYVEDGTRPLKKIDCKQCINNDDCTHNQKYY